MLVSVHGQGQKQDQRAQSGTQNNSRAAHGNILIYVHTTFKAYVFKPNYVVMSSPGMDKVLDGLTEHKKGGRSRR